MRVRGDQQEIDRRTRDRCPNHVPRCASLAFCFPRLSLAPMAHPADVPSRLSFAYPSSCNLRVASFLSFSSSYPLPIHMPLPFSSSHSLILPLLPFLICFRIPSAAARLASPPFIRRHVGPALHLMKEYGASERGKVKDESTHTSIQRRTGRRRCPPHDQMSYIVQTRSLSHS